MEVSCSSLTGHGTLHFGKYMLVEMVTFSVGMWVSVSDPCCGTVVHSTHWYNICPQVNACGHQLGCYGMLVELSMGLDQNTWHG